MLDTSETVSAARLADRRWFACSPAHPRLARSRLALDATGRVVVIEVKRDVDRNDLAQCLEYAGWTRLTTLDEVVGLYDAGVIEHHGVEAFFKGWQDFTGTTTQRKIQLQPRLTLIAREAGGRICSAKDAQRSPEKVRTTYPHPDDLLSVKSRVDSEHRLESNFARRLQHTVR